MNDLTAILLGGGLVGFVVALIHLSLSCAKLSTALWSFEMEVSILNRQLAEAKQYQECERPEHFPPFLEVLTWRELNDPDVAAIKEELEDPEG